MFTPGLTGERRKIRWACDTFDTFILNPILHWQRKRGEGMRKWMTEMWIFDSVMKGERRQEMIWKGLQSKRGGKGREMPAWNLFPSHLSTRLSINYLIPWLVITHHPSKEKNPSDLCTSHWLRHKQNSHSLTSAHFYRSLPVFLFHL